MDRVCSAIPHWTQFEPSHSDSTTPGVMRVSRIAFSNPGPKFGGDPDRDSVQRKKISQTTISMGSMIGTV